MNTGLMKKGVYLFVFILIVQVMIFTINTFEEKPSSTDFTINNSILIDNFSKGILNTQTWQITHEGDFNESIVEVYDIDPTENIDYRLRLRANTIGTSDDTVKFHGVRSIHKFDFNESLNISFDIDWNNQSNGCYLTSSIYLCPTITNANPRDENDWLKIEYIGVPPGQNARIAIANKIDGRIKLLYTEGWPEEQTGRKIANQHINIIIDNKTYRIIENNEEIYTAPSYNLAFTSIYIYLQMSSHSNYPIREIYFDNIAIVEDT